MRWNIRINAAAIVAAAVLALATGALLAWTIADAGRNRAARVIERQLRGDLTDQENRVADLDLALRKARSHLVAAEELNDRHRSELVRLQKELGERDLLVRRHSQAEFELRAEIESVRSQATVQRRDGGRVEYSFRNEWLSFFTPNVFASGGETISLFGIHPRVRITGIAQKHGVLQTETIDLEFFDATGRALPFETKLVDYEFEFAPLIRDAPAPSALERIHLDLYGHASLGVPTDTVYARGSAGAELSLWNVSVLVRGEVDTNRTARLMVGVGGRWRLF